MTMTDVYDRWMAEDDRRYMRELEGDMNGKDWTALEYIQLLEDAMDEGDLREARGHWANLEALRGRVIHTVITDYTNRVFHWPPIAYGPHEVTRSASDMLTDMMGAM
ncbi:MAG: hypothetical protein AAGK74_00290 [Chloroflexota bacterium]